MNNEQEIVYLKEVLGNSDEIVKNAMLGYLRVSLNDGMPLEQYKNIVSTVEDAARLGYFSLALAETFDDKCRKHKCPDTHKQ